MLVMVSRSDIGQRPSHVKWLCVSPQAPRFGSSWALVCAWAIAATIVREYRRPVRLACPAAIDQLTEHVGIVLQAVQRLFARCFAEGRSSFRRAQKVPRGGINLHVSTLWRKCVYSYACSITNPGLRGIPAQPLTFQKMRIM